MPLGQRKRKAFLAGGILLGGLVLLWLLLPLWFPWALRPLARQQRIHFARYERQGWQQFTLHGVGFTNQDVEVRAARVEAVFPTRWLWRTWKPEQRTLVARVTDWEVNLPAGRSAGRLPPRDHPPFDFAKLARELQRWIPGAALSNGTIHARQLHLVVPAATFAAGELSTEVRLPEVKPSVKLAAHLDPDQSLILTLHSEGWRWGSTNRVSQSGTGLRLESENWWWSNRVSLAAEFGMKTLLPEKASLRVTNLFLPETLVAGQPYGKIQGSISADWENSSFTVDADLNARAAENDPKYPPLKLSLHARGDTNQATVDSAVLTAPGLTTQLSSNLNLHFSGELLREPARLGFAADLSQYPSLGMQGRVEGAIEAQPGDKTRPRVRFSVKGSEVGLREMVAKEVQTQGVFEWPELRIEQAVAAFIDGSRLEIEGRLDCARGEVVTNQIRFNGPLLGRWLPPGYAYRDLSLNLGIQGSLDELRHQGRLKIAEFTGPVMQPMQVDFDWTGAGTGKGSAHITALAGRSSMKAGLSMDLWTNLQQTEEEIVLELNSCSIERSNVTLLELQQPVQFRMDGLPPHLPQEGKAKMSRLLLNGSAGEVLLEGEFWPFDHAGWRVAISRFRPSLFQDFFKPAIEPIEVKKLICAGGWTNGPARFDLQLAAAGMADSPLPLAIETVLRGDESGVVISNLLVTSQETAVAQARGSLPVRFDFTRETNMVSLEAGLPLQLWLTTQPEAVFWNKFADWSGVVLEAPECDVELTGTWGAPLGHVRMKVGRFHFRHAAREVPQFERLQLNLELDRERVRLTEGIFFVQQQPVTLTGEMPLGNRFWTQLNQLPDWEQASGRLRVEEAQVAAFAALLPSLLAPQGTLAVDCALLPGGKLDGHLMLHQGRTRPLGNVGAIRDIESRLVFEDRTLKLERATANLGGATVMATGAADLAGSAWLKGEVPPFQFKLQGTNVPLSRQPESILRSDLDLTVTKSNGAPAVISGMARLRDSFYLRNLQDLVPGSVASPRRRPPYFSVEWEPFADWRLSAQVSGNRFLKVRSTLFNGEVSANLKLEGTLRDPIVVGDVRVDSGVIRFPFASLKVQQGFVMLSLDNPHRPQLLVEAESKKFGYDVKLEASGPVDVPVLQFSSIPPLSSEQIVLMLTAGELPRGDVSLTPQQKAQTVAVFFGSDLLARFGLGDDSEERLSFESGEQVSEQGRPTYSLEYKLTERWSLTGEYDRFNAFNAGLKWKIYSK